jgi:hypothetical protein
MVFIFNVKIFIFNQSLLQKNHREIFTPHLLTGIPIYFLLGVIPYSNNTVLLLLSKKTEVINL